MKKKLEICVDILESAFIAEKMGADRIELCSSLSLGGVTPSYGMMEIAAQISIPVYAMIRPRGGDFVYSNQEIEWMLKDIHAAAQAGVAGVVFGCLDETLSFDKDAMLILQKAAKKKKLSITVHRAFDLTYDPFESLDFLIELGIERLLTSGQKRTAIEGSELIRQLIKQSSGNISIMPGSGVHPKNLRECIKKTNAQEFHFSAKDASPPLKESNISIGNHGVNTYITANADLIAEARFILDEA